MHEKYVFVFEVSRRFRRRPKRGARHAHRLHCQTFAWASWNAQNGTPLFPLRESGGRESPEIVRYAHTSADQSSPVCRLCELRMVKTADCHCGFAIDLAQRPIVGTWNQIVAAVNLRAIWHKGGRWRQFAAHLALDAVYLSSLIMRLDSCAKSSAN